MSNKRTKFVIELDEKQLQILLFGKSALNHMREDGKPNTAEMADLLNTIIHQLIAQFAEKLKAFSEGFSPFAESGDDGVEGDSK